MFSPLTLEELQGVLGQFKKEKSLGSDGWTSEFFIFFFDLLGEDLLAMVEESSIKGAILGGLNSTFLTLIPKSYRPRTFDDFHPISLCNLCYKVFSK